MRFTAVSSGVKLAAPATKEKLAGYRRLDEEGHWLEGYHELGARSLPRLSSRLSWSDRLGALRVRLGLGRDRYRVLPGLYAFGSPDADSPVLVTANYKLSLDALRRELRPLIEPGAGRQGAFVLVLDTKGVNVWCAAGKGSFGTEELLDKLAKTRLGDLVAHRVLILPQLGAPGVSAPEIRRLSGFRVVWGPVRARDIPAFLAAGMKKSPAMGRVNFNLRSRLVLAPLELVQAWPLIPAALAAGLLTALPPGPTSTARGLGVAAILIGSWLLATVGFPALLFLLPSRVFAIKGAILGIVWGIGASLLLGLAPGMTLALGLVSGAVSSYIGMNFTGCSTFTSPTGALAEVETAILPQIAALALGLGLGLVSRIFGV